MSPHAVTPSAHETAAESKSYLAGKFAVTSNGFLPADAPPAALTDPYYASWEALAQHLPQLIRDGTLRQRVCALEVLSTDRLKTEAEWRRAYVILGFLTHGYVWGGCQAAEVLPAAIAVPFVDVAEHLEVPPVLTYAASNLWNFSCRGGADFTDMGALRSQVTFTGTESESWFFMISVAMEAQAAALIGPVLRAVEAGVRGRDYARLAAACDALAAGIGRVGALLDRMYERCDPDVFYHQIRPFLAGSKNMEAAGLPRGVFYQEEAGDDPAAADGRGTWRQLRGGSNGQSSMIQFFDIVLGVEHTHEGNHTPHARAAAKASPNQQQQQQPKPADEDQPRSFHEEVRDYMPGPHRRFLQHVGRQGSLRELAQQPAATEAQRLFAAAFTGATEALGRFRNKHIQIVTRYIVLPAKRAAMQAKSAATAASPPSSSQTGAAAAAAAVAGRHNLATSSAAASAGTDAPSQDEPELKGTGGTTLIPFLKQARDETFEAGVLRRS